MTQCSARRRARTRKAADHVLPNFAGLAHVGLDHGAAHGHLAVRHQHHLHRRQAARQSGRRQRRQRAAARQAVPTSARGQRAAHKTRSRVHQLLGPATVVECTSASLLLLLRLLHADLLSTLGSLKPPRLLLATPPTWGAQHRTAPARERAACSDSIMCSNVGVLVTVRGWGGSFRCWCVPRRAPGWRCRARCAHALPPRVFLEWKRLLGLAGVEENILRAKKMPKCRCWLPGQQRPTSKWQCRCRRQPQQLPPKPGSLPAGGTWRHSSNVDNVDKPDVPYHTTISMTTGWPKGKNRLLCYS